MHLSAIAIVRLPHTLCAQGEDEMSETTATPKPRMRLGLGWWVLIAVGVLAVLSFLAVAGLGIFAFVNHSLRETSPDQPFIEGSPQQPDAESPLICPKQCFDITAATLLAVTAEDVAQLSINDEVPDVSGLSTVADVAPAVGEQWLELGGDEECAFIPVNAPYISVGPDSTSPDPVSWVQAWETDAEMTDIAGRVFPSTEEASAFMRDLHDRVTACPWQDMNLPTAGGADTYLVEITPQAAIDVPDEVAAVGWVREGTPGPRWRSYVWDLQRGNLVVQVRVLTDGRILEQDVATYTEILADRLSGLQPTKD